MPGELFHLRQSMSTQILGLIIAPICSFLGVWWVFFKILRLAKEKNMVDNPDARKLQKTPIPVLGGLAVFFGACVGLTVASVFIDYTNGGDTLFGAMVIMLYIGWIDDTQSLSPQVRIVAELIAIGCLCAATGGGVNNLQGLWGIYEIPTWASVPLTLFAGVGIINAVNMIDGVNGLSSGLSIVYCLLFGLFLYLGGDIANATLAGCMVGAIIPFWLHNVFGKTSKMFVGDAGTMVLGLLFTYFIIQFLHTDTPVLNHLPDSICLVALCLAILSVPIFDTLRVMTRRKMKGLGMFTPDKTHLHHIFIGYGVSHSVTALIIIGINTLVTGLSWLTWYAGIGIDVQLYITIGLGLIFVWGTYILLYYIKRRQPKAMEKLTHLSMAVEIEGTKWWEGISDWLDAPEFQTEEQKKKRDEIRDSRNERKFEHSKDVQVNEGE